MNKLSTVLTLTNVVGVGGTAFMCALDTKNALEVIREKNLEGENLKTKVKACWKCYWRTMLVAGITIGSGLGSHGLAAKEIASLSAAAATLKALHAKYGDKVREILGEVKESEVRKEITKDLAEEKLHETPPDMEKIRKEDPDAILVYEPYSDSFIVTTMENVERSKYEVNKLFQRQEYVEIEDWLGLLLEDAEEGKTYAKGKKGGWYVDNTFWARNWDFFGAPWIDVELEYVPQLDSDVGEDYYYLAYGLKPDQRYDDNPNVAGAFKRYTESVDAAKERWDENTEKELVEAKAELDSAVADSKEATKDENK